MAIAIAAAGPLDPPELLPAAAILDAASLDPNRGIPSGGWFVVRGRNLMDGPAVSIGGQPAAIARLRRVAAYDEILALAPALQSGSATVVVTTPGGAAPPRSVRIVDFSPSLFGLDPAGGRYVDATASGGSESIGPLDLYGAATLDRPIRPAVEGEIISLRANGCGVPESVTVRLGEREAAVLFSGTETGLLPTCVIRIRVPALPAGEHEIRAVINGVALTPPRWLVTGLVPFPGYEHGKESGFRLTGAHVALPCAQCHLRGRYLGTPTACEACHLDRYQNAALPDHRAAGYPATCESCHQTSQFRGARAAHPSSVPPLSGKHTVTPCGSCHTASRPERLNTNCSTCHQAAVSPNHSAQPPANCDACHTTAAFRPAALDHPRQRFPLEGAHASLACSQCHQGGTLPAPDPSCASCHLPLYQSATAPDHPASGYPPTCGVCHTPAAWQGAALRHERFPLTGKHASTACLACHKDNQFAGTPRACAGCHLPQYDAMTAPNHRAEGFSLECQLCHSTSQFFGARVVHPAFAQTGSHTALECARCHTTGAYKGTPHPCASCHLNAYNATANPNHQAAGFARNCENCHTSAAWLGARFTHARFQLTGRHTALQCRQCHASGAYSATPATCASCHLPAYNAAANHKAAAYPQTCETCHTTAAWKGAAFPHTKFALTGKHASTACALCHTGGRFAGTPTACASCHLPAYNSTASPAHKAAGLPQTCQSCHTTSAWPGAKFSHARFSLTGRHATLKCSQCHKTGIYAGTSTACSSCHLPAYTNTSNPNHTAAGYPRTCESCHTTASWRGATVPHTRFSLTGRHAVAPCSACHPSGSYTGTPTDCVNCHLPAYNAAANPNHKTAGFSQACQSCHTTTSWRGATFAHRSFVLAGKHASLACAQCHTNGTYAARPTSCVSCHLARFNATTRPSHASKAYPQTCERCHTPSAWVPASFLHAFPIMFGEHANAWTRCTDCHANPALFSQVSCFRCHSQSVTGARHKSVSGYVYDSRKCIACHPRP